MANLSSVARCAASPNNLRATVRLAATIMRSNVTEPTQNFGASPACPVGLAFGANLFANAREYLLFPAPAEAATAQVSVPSLS